MTSILLIDDNPILRKVWSEQVKLFSIQALATIEEAEKVLALAFPDAILVDLVLPRSDGEEFLSALRQQYPASPVKTVLLVTHAERAEDLAAELLEGIDAVWVKSELLPGVLQSRLQALLKGEDPPPPDRTHGTWLDALVASNIVTAEQGKNAGGQNCLPERTLFEQKAVPAALLPYLHELACKTDYLTLSKLHPDPRALALLDATSAARHKVFPLRTKAGRLRVAMVDPQDLPTLDLVARLTGCQIDPVLSTQADIETAIMVHYGGHRSVHDAQAAAPAQEHHFLDQKSIEDEMSEQPVIELIDSLLIQALEQRASDIHIERHESEVIVRFRIDGILHDERHIPAELADSMIARIKILGNMDVSERRLPLDGRYQIRLQDRPIDFRISTIPVMDGEKSVLRILDRTAMKVDMADIGFSPPQLARYQALLARPYGLILVTGPTGSGKTSTLYASLNHLQSPGVNLVSIEDPVEYRIDRVNQIQVNERIGLTFSTILRSVLRQDPNVVLVGEIRDRETAELAVQAALTGHLVLATLHTNDAPGALIRLVDMGVPDYLVASTVTAVLAQRLVRRICEGCIQEYQPTPEELATLHATGGLHLMKGLGCEGCRGTGYRGRMAVFELLEVTDTIRRAFLQHPQSIYRLAREDGMETMRTSALARVLQGITTLPEVNRVSVADRVESGAHLVSHET